MKNYDKLFVWLGLVFLVIAGFVAHEVSKWAFVFIAGIYIPLCVFCTERSANKFVGFVVAAFATLVVMVLLSLNAHYLFMLIPALMLVVYALLADKDCLSSLWVWLSVLVWGTLLFCLNCLMFLLV